MDSTVSGNIAPYIVIAALVAAGAISLINARFITLMLCVVALGAFAILGRSLEGNLIVKEEVLASRLKPEVPVKGYKWIGVGGWILYKDGKPESIAIYGK